MPASDVNADLVEESINFSTMFGGEDLQPSTESQSENTSGMSSSTQTNNININSNNDTGNLYTVSKIQLQTLQNVPEHDSASELPMPNMTRKDGRPRSGYDRNADWYCGNDADNHDSIHSYGSSILSAFQIKKEIEPMLKPDTKEETIEDSMNFSILVDGKNQSSSTKSPMKSQSENTRPMRNSTQTNSSSSIDAGHLNNAPMVFLSETLQTVPVSELGTNSNPIDDVSTDLEESATKISTMYGASTAVFSLAEQNKSNNDKKGQKWILVRRLMIGVTVLLIIDIALLCLYLRER